MFGKQLHVGGWYLASNPYCFYLITGAITILAIPNSWISKSNDTKKKPLAIFINQAACGFLIRGMLFINLEYPQSRVISLYDNHEILWTTMCNDINKLTDNSLEKNRWFTPFCIHFWCIIESKNLTKIKIEWSYGISYLKILNSWVKFNGKIVDSGCQRDTKWGGSKWDISNGHDSDQCNYCLLACKWLFIDRAAILPRSESLTRVWCDRKYIRRSM